MAERPVTIPWNLRIAAAPTSICSSSHLFPAMATNTARSCPLELHDRSDPTDCWSATFTSRKTGRITYPGDTGTGCFAPSSCAIAHLRVPTETLAISPFTIMAVIRLLAFSSIDQCRMSVAIRRSCS